MKLRSVLGVSILAGWSVVLGLHVRREYFRSEGERLEAGVKTLAPGSHFYVVRMHGRAIGTATSRLDTLADTIFLEDNLLLDVPALDTVTRAVTMTRLALDTRLRMRKFAFRLDSRIGSFVAEGVMQPDSSLAVSLNAGGSTQQSRVSANGGVTLDAAVTVRLAAAGRLVPGTEVSVRTFDPSAMATRAMTVRVTGVDTLIVPDSARVDGSRGWVMSSLDTVPVWRIDQQMGGIAIASWVDEDGLVVRAESPLGFVIERTTYELARQEWASATRDPALAAGYGLLIESTAIQSNVDPAMIAALDGLSVRLKGVELEGFDLSGGRQQLHGDTLRIKVEDLEWVRQAGYRLPYRGIDSVALELNPSPLIQSDDPEIRRVARQATSGTPDPDAAAQRLNQFVYRTLRKEITPSIPSALQVLQAKRGDCNEHTVLYVALARSIGLPARTAVGLVYVRSRFYYHAWPEVWLNGQWVPVDPTLNQFPADASHLRFLVGGLARQVELLRLIGRLEIDVI